MSLTISNFVELLTSNDEAPTFSMYLPASAIQHEHAGSYDAKSRIVSGKLTICVSPGANILVFANIFNSLCGFFSFLFGALM